MRKIFLDLFFNELSSQQNNLTDQKLNAANLFKIQLNVFHQYCLCAY